MSLLHSIFSKCRSVELTSGTVIVSPMMKYIDAIVDDDYNYIEKDMEERKLRIINSTATKTLLYKSYNPSLGISDIYTRKHYIPEHWRRSWTRFRLGSTNLPCEKQKWNRDNVSSTHAVCICGEPQTENHILFSCNYKVNFLLSDNMEDFFSS